MTTMTHDASAIETVERIRAGDPDDMLRRIKELSQQVRDAWAIASGATLPPAYGDVRNITVTGMGGSAIGGDLAAALLADELKVPMFVHRDYGAPAYVGRDSLVITTGGKIAELARASNFPIVTFSYKAQPRAALGYSLALVLGVLSKLAFV